MRDFQQTSDTVLLVRPAAFGFHPEAAESNLFASDDVAAEAQDAALREFEALRAALEEAGVRCLVLDDSADPAKPDAIFPNNWVTFHGDGQVVTYPMTNVARRLERRTGDVLTLLEDAGFRVGETLDLAELEQAGDYLEGTGSLIFDRVNARAFACRSPRTTAQALEAFRAATGWDVVEFEAADAKGREIYHTNVMVMLGTRFAIVCVDAIAPKDRARVIAAIEEGGRELIEVRFDQMERFACNLIELRTAAGESLIALSQTAADSLDPDQRAALERLGGRLIAVDVSTIERVGGGSVRCMIAEVFLPHLSSSRA